MHLGLSVEELAQMPALIAMNTLTNAATENATVVLPACGFAEKRGSMVNGKGRLQRLNRTTCLPGNARDDWEILRDLLQAIGGGDSLHSIEDFFRRISETVPQFAGLSLSKIGDLGVQFSKWKNCRRRIPATKKQSNKLSQSRLHVAVFGTSWTMRKLIPVHRRFDKSNHKRRLGGKTDDDDGVFLHHHLAAEDRNSAGGDRVHGVLCSVRGTPGQRVYSGPRWAESRWAAGLFQPIADMFKLLLKEDFTPRAANTFYYWLAPCLAVMPAIITFAVVPFGILCWCADRDCRH